ncbi:MAG: hypothetical protein KZQ82_14635 [Candidatus Thiodiazotropha sp. (ex Lucinoma annulata)]|nr:hypothetical protein [Candidatus Thiodiazotropha sp. (ex Lucinoma annulata)]MCU7945919.1 hypothetical protein [Candidatus Thiodiazotropha sp. (ex Cardiolucina cf. quadrata)]
MRIREGLKGEKWQQPACTRMLYHKQQVVRICSIESNDRAMIYRPAVE